MVRKSQKRKSQKNQHRRAASKKRNRRTAVKKAVQLEYSQRLEAGVQHMRKGDAAAAAARKVGVPPSVLRRYALKTGIVSRKSGKWVFKRDRRFRRMPLYSDGARAVVTVHNSKTAKLIGQYMSAVGRFFETEDISLLEPFQGQSIRDVTGKRYTFEVRPNVLFRLDASGVEPFELVYSVVKPS